MLVSVTAVVSLRYDLFSNILYPEQLVVKDVPAGDDNESTFSLHFPFDILIPVFLLPGVMKTHHI